MSRACAIGSLPLSTNSLAPGDNSARRNSRCYTAARDIRTPPPRLAACEPPSAIVVPNRAIVPSDSNRRYYASFPPMPKLPLKLFVRFAAQHGTDVLPASFAARQRRSPAIISHLPNNARNNRLQYAVFANGIRQCA